MSATFCVALVTGVVLGADFLTVTIGGLWHGLLICSGIIREREQDVLDAARAAGYAVADRIEKGEWVALCLRNEAA